MRALWLPQAFDRFDVNWAPVYGWETRGDSVFNPRVGIDHHTAGPSAKHGPRPSLGVVTNGRKGLPGPLSETHQGRDNLVHLVASGRANHAGAGGWAGYSGNSRAWGNERENVGTIAEPWRPDQHNMAARVHAAWIWGMEEFEGVVIPVANITRHAGWTSRKIDTHSVTVAVLQANVQAVLDGNDPEPELPPLGDNTMLLVQYPAGDKYYLVAGGRITWISDPADLKNLQEAGIPDIGDVSQSFWQSLCHMFGRPWTGQDVGIFDGFASSDR